MNKLIKFLATALIAVGTAMAVEHQFISNNHWWWGSRTADNSWSSNERFPPTSQNPLVASLVVRNAGFDFWNQYPYASMELKGNRIIGTQSFLNSIEIRYSSSRDLYFGIWEHIDWENGENFENQSVYLFELPAGSNQTITLTFNQIFNSRDNISFENMVNQKDFWLVFSSETPGTTTNITVTSLILKMGEIVFVPVSNIGGIPSSAALNQTITLSPTITPGNASNRNITWSVVNGEATISGNNFTPRAAGIVRIRATIVNGLGVGSNYTQDFDIYVAAPIIPVSNISGIPSSAVAGETIVLSPTVTPSNATNRNITWSVVNGNATINENNFTPNAAGTITIRATITNGLATGINYTQDFSISVAMIPVSDISGIPNSAAVGETITLSPIITPSNATNKNINWSVVNGNATINGNNFTPNAVGTVRIMATIANGIAQGNNFTKTFDISATIPLAIWDGKTIDTLWYDPNAQTYSIRTAAELAGLAHLVNNGNNGRGIPFTGKTITLRNDIFLNDTAGSTSANFNPQGKNVWTPIGYFRGSGSNSHLNRPFDGEFEAVPERRKIFGLYIPEGSDNHGQGLFGFATSTLRDFDVLNGQINSNGNAKYVGGVVGVGRTVSNVISDITVNAKGSHSGGIAGAVPRITNSSFIGNVNARDTVGGLVGHLDNVGTGGIISNRGIINSYTNGNIKGTQIVGGLAGHLGINAPAVTNSYSRGRVEGIFQVGGLVGQMRSGTITNSRSSSAVIGDDNVGGLVGTVGASGDNTVNAKIENSYANGSVTGTGMNTSSGNDNLGGLVGFAYGGSILKSWSSANVTGTTTLGGLVGRAQNITINQAFSRGRVTGIPMDDVSPIRIGGLIGRALDANITEAYSSGAVSGGNPTGSFIGFSEGNLRLTRTYVDITASGQSQGIGRNDGNSESPIGKNTSEMKQQHTFFGWDFVNVWGINPQQNDGYPILRGIGDNEITSISNIRKSDNRHGIKFTQNIVSDQAEISVILPNNERVVETKIVIYDMTGNVVWTSTASTGSATGLVWDLRNSAGRFVANGTYLVIAEVKDRNGKIYQYSARLGVKR